MKQVSNITLSFLIIVMMLISCKREKHPNYKGNISDSIVINKKNNGVDTQLDSLGFLDFIGNKNLQDVYDIATWQYKKPEDSVLSVQLKNYFWVSDSMSIPSLYQEIDSIKAYYAMIDNLKLLPKDSLDEDSIGKMQYRVYYFGNDKKYISHQDKRISYILNKQEDGSSKFRYYFYDLLPKDTTLVGVTQ